MSGWPVVSSKLRDARGYVLHFLADNEGSSTSFFAGTTASPKRAHGFELPISTLQGSEVYYGEQVDLLVLLPVAMWESSYPKGHVFGSSAMTRVVIDKIDDSYIVFMGGYGLT